MRLRAILAAFAFVVIATAALAQSLTFPELTGRVVDEAGILDTSTREQLEKLSADLEAKTTDQLVVVTLKSLQGTSIEDYGYQLGRKWQIGQKDKNNGVVLIVAPNDKRVRIEVGYGLEPTLTDAMTSVIIQGSILPRFRAGDFAGGTLRGAQDIAQVLSGDAKDIQERATQRQAAAARTLTPAELLIMAFWIFVAITIVVNVIADIRRRGRPLSRGSVRRTRDWTDYNPVIIGGGSSSGSSWGGGGGGGFSGGGGSFGGGGSSGSW